MKKLFTTFIIAVLALSSSAQVTADFTISDTLCVGEMAKFKANSSGVQIYYWNFGDDPNFTGWVPTQDSSYGRIFYSAGAFYVKLMVTSGMGGSRDTIEKAIYIRPKPTINVDLEPYSSNGSYCISTVFTVSRWGSMSGFDSLSWDFGDGFESADRYPIHQYSKAGMHKVMLTGFNRKPMRY